MRAESSRKPPPKRIFVSALSFSEGAVVSFNEGKAAGFQPIMHSKFSIIEIPLVQPGYSLRQLYFVLPAKRVKAAYVA